MKRMIFLLLLTTTPFAYSQGDLLPGGPLDSDIGDAAGNAAGGVNQITPNDEFEQEQEEIREDELTESRFDVPDKKEKKDRKEEKEFNKNGTNEP